MISNFLPHSVVGIIVLPVVARTGARINHEKLVRAGKREREVNCFLNFLQKVVMMAGLMNSGASCLPVSSFPNANSFAQRRSGEKEEVLTTWDYIKSGVPMVSLTFYFVFVNIWFK